VWASLPERVISCMIARLYKPNRYPWVGLVEFRGQGKSRGHLGKHLTI
jgi:hypothetical protein